MLKGILCAIATILSLIAIFYISIAVILFAVIPIAFLLRLDKLVLKLRHKYLRYKQREK